MVKSRKKTSDFGRDPLIPLKLLTAKEKKVLEWTLYLFIGNLLRYNCI